jgi:hypothetical protein
MKQHTTHHQQKPILKSIHGNTIEKPIFNVTILFLSIMWVSIFLVKIVKFIQIKFYQNEHSNVNLGNQIKIKASTI